MELVTIYECFCDRTRLRILNLLSQGPLCVCHVQEVLGEPQVKVSKHLAYLKKHGLVTATWEGNWRIYALVAKPTAALKANLACLQDCAGEDKIFRTDRAKLVKVRACVADDSPLATCCAPAHSVTTSPRKKASRP